MEQKLVEYLEAFEEAAVQLGPQALDLAVQVTFWESVGSIALGIVLLVTLSLISFVTYKVFTRESADDEERGLVVTVGALLGAIPIGGVSHYLFNYWNWIGVFAPHIRLARDIMERL